MEINQILSNDRENYRRQICEANFIINEQEGEIKKLVSTVDFLSKHLDGTNVSHILMLSIFMFLPNTL